MLGCLFGVTGGASYENRETLGPLADLCCAGTDVIDRLRLPLIGLIPDISDQTSHRDREMCCMFEL